MPILTGDFNFKGLTEQPADIDKTLPINLDEELY
jgi:hypothetical protein